MADLTKCFSGCEKQKICKRWVAPADPVYQSYADFKPDENGYCKNYWPANEAL